MVAEGLGRERRMVEIEGVIKGKLNFVWERPRNARGNCGWRGEICTGVAGQSKRE